MKRGDSVAAKRVRGPYANKGVSTEARALVAEYAEAAHAAGTPLRTFLSFGENTSYSPGRSTLFAHAAAVKAGEDIFVLEETRGRKKRLAEDQLRVLFGAVLEAGEEVDLAKMAQFANDFPGVKADDSTWSRYAKAGQLTFRLVGGRYMPKKMTFEKYGNIYYDCVRELVEDGFFVADRSMWACFDFASNSVRLRRIKTSKARAQNSRSLPQSSTRTPARMPSACGVMASTGLLHCCSPTTQPSTLMVRWLRRSLSGARSMGLLVTGSTGSSPRSSTVLRPTSRLMSLWAATGLSSLLLAC